MLCAKCARIQFSLIHIFPYKHRIIGSVLKREKNESEKTRILAYFAQLHLQRREVFLGLFKTFSIKQV